MSYSKAIISTSISPLTTKASVSIANKMLDNRNQHYGDLKNLTLSNQVFGNDFYLEDNFV